MERDARGHDDDEKNPNRDCLNFDRGRRHEEPGSSAVLPTLERLPLIHPLSLRLMDGCKWPY